MTTKARLGVGTVLCSLTLGGCSFYDASRVEADFGNSVRQMVQEQIYDTQAASNPSEDVMPVDGVILDNSIKTYRGDVEKETSEARSLSISF